MPRTEPDIEGLTTSPTPVGDIAKRNGGPKNARAAKPIQPHGEQARLETLAMQLDYLDQQALTLTKLVTKLQRRNSAAKRVVRQRAKKKR